MGTPGTPGTPRHQGGQEAGGVVVISTFRKAVPATGNMVKHGETWRNNREMAPETNIKVYKNHKWGNIAISCNTTTCLSCFRKNGKFKRVETTGV